MTSTDEDADHLQRLMREAQIKAMRPTVPARGRRPLPPPVHSQE